MKWIWVILLLVPAVLRADDTRSFDYSGFSRIPVLHEGRIKPLSSVARVILREIHGDTSTPDASAIQWMASVLFNPSQAMQQKLFVVHSSVLVQTLSLPPDKDGVYSFQEMAAAFDAQEALIKSIAVKDKNTLSAEEQEIAHLYMGVNDF